MKDQNEEIEKLTQDWESGKATVSKKSKQPWYKRKRTLYYASGALAVFLLAWLIWHKQMSDMWASLFGTKPIASSVKVASLDDKSGLSPASSATGTGSSGSTTNTSRNGSSNTSSDSSKSTTTTTTTTTTTNPPTTDGGGSTPDNSAALLSLAANVTPGMSRGQIISIAGGTQPNSCTDITLLNLVQQSVCTWTIGGKSVVVTLQNGVVVGQPIKIGL